MYIPSHYVFLFVAILLGESAVVFVYTVIGLIKSNPMPYMIPPVMAPAEQLPVCAYYGPSNLVQLIAAETSTVTTTIYETITSIAAKTDILQTVVPVLFQPRPLDIFTTTTSESGSVTASTSSSSTTSTAENDLTTTTSTASTMNTVTLVVFSTAVVSASAATEPPRSTVYITTVVPPSATT